MDDQADDTPTAGRSRQTASQALLASSELGADASNLVCCLGTPYSQFLQGAAELHQPLSRVRGLLFPPVELKGTRISMVRARLLRIQDSET